MHLSLYRKYRPKLFLDVVGQDNNVRTLQNEVKNNRLSHAYLFIGSKGTGKTSCARIMAKAVNCRNPKDGEPCLCCDICTGIDKNQILDVAEIDAASNNGVNYIRAINDEVSYTPAVAKYKVYIIDEVHMLSNDAFNALLKTLEEPPSHVIFILCTTEYQSIPATVMSRCQRFDFNRISPETIKNRVLHVCKEENIKISENAALSIGRIADGALRDALSLLDRASSETDGDVNEEFLEKMLGISSSVSISAMLEALVEKDSEKAINLIDEVYNSSSSIRNYLKQLESFLRDVFIAKTVKNANRILYLQEDEFARLSELSQKFSISQILSLIERVIKTLEQISSGMNARLAFELLVIRFIHNSDILNVEIISQNSQNVSSNKTENAKNIAAKSETSSTNIKSEKIAEKEDKTSDNIIDNKNQEISDKNISGLSDDEIYRRIINDSKTISRTLFIALSNATCVLGKNSVTIIVSAKTTIIDKHRAFLEKRFLDYTGREIEIFVQMANANNQNTLQIDDKYDNISASQKSDDFVTDENKMDKFIAKLKELGVKVNES